MLVEHLRRPLPSCAFHHAPSHLVFSKDTVMTLDLDFVPVAQLPECPEPIFNLEIMKGSSRCTHTLGAVLRPELAAAHVRYLASDNPDANVSLVKFHYATNKHGDVVVEAVALDDIKAFDRELGFITMKPKTPRRPARTLEAG